MDRTCLQLGPCLALLPCPVLPCDALPCPALPCPVLSCLPRFVDIKITNQEGTGLHLVARTQYSPSLVLPTLSSENRQNGVQMPPGAVQAMSRQAHIRVSTLPSPFRRPEPGEPCSSPFRWPKASRSVQTETCAKPTSITLHTLHTDTDTDGGIHMCNRCQGSLVLEPRRSLNPCRGHAPVNLAPQPPRADIGHRMYPNIIATVD